MRSLLFFGILLLSGLAQADLQDLLSQIEVPESAAFLGWKTKENWSTETGDVFALKQTSLNCSDKTLVPTHPQQTTKKYHHFLVGRFNVPKVKADSRVCKIKTQGSNSRCLMADTMEFALISDTYQDLCGNKYRGFWALSFLRQDESMGTLFAKGKSTYSNPKSQFANDMLDDGTYALQVDDFLFLTSLLPGDEKQISENLTMALKYTHDRDPQTLLFTVRP